MTRPLLTREQYEAAAEVAKAGDALAQTRARLAYEQAEVRRAIQNAIETGVNHRDLIIPSGMSARYVYLIWREMREEAA